MDPDNPIVRLCAEGMEAEASGRPADARRLFEQAWEASSDDYERCIAAHYVARVQESDADRLEWNAESLRCAGGVGGERVKAFYPSLLLNLGYSHEAVGDRVAAAEFYALATGRLGDLPDGPYARMVRRGISEGQRRLSDSGSTDGSQRRATHDSAHESS